MHHQQTSWRIFLQSFVHYSPTRALGSLSASKDIAFQSCIAVSNFIKQLHWMKQRNAPFTSWWSYYTTYHLYKPYYFITILSNLLHIALKRLTFSSSFLELHDNIRDSLFCWQSTNHYWRSQAQNVILFIVENTKPLIFRRRLYNDSVVACGNICG